MASTPNVKTVVTIDVEPDSDRHWKRKSPLSFSSLFNGLPYLKRLSQIMQVPFVFFLSPEVLFDHAALSALLNFPRYEIGAHLHAEYVPPAQILNAGDPAISAQFPCSDIDNRTEKAKIAHLTTQIKTLTGHQPISYRAARYGADLDTINSIKDLGYKIDSSATPHINWVRSGGPDFRNVPEQPYFISQLDFTQKSDSGILEAPITIGHKRLPGLPNKWYFYQWLRPNITMVIEQKMLIRQRIKKYGNHGPVYFNLMFHSNEMKDGCSPSLISAKVLLRKLQNILCFLAAQGSHFYTLAEIHSDII